MSNALHLTAIGLLAPHLTADNHDRVLGAARHKSKREVEVIVAALRPQPAVASSVRRLPTPSGPPTPAAAASQPSHFTAEAHSVQIATSREIAPPVHEMRQDVAAVKALAPERYKVQFTVSRETHEKLSEAQNLLRHRIPDGDVAAIFERALTLLLNELHKTRHALVERPRMASLTEGTAVTFQRPSSERSGSETAASVRSRAEWDAAPSAVFSSITTGFPSRMAARRVLTTSSFGVARTMHLRRNAGLEGGKRISFAK